ncbi:MAG: BamA/TamA family outer membrane protein [Planctomycetota bacterium]|jgi:hypothetical protein
MNPNQRRATAVRSTRALRWLAAAACSLALCGCRSTATDGDAGERKRPDATPARTGGIVAGLEEAVGSYIKEAPMELGTLGDDTLLKPNSPRDAPAGVTGRWIDGIYRAMPVPLASPMIGIGAGLAVGYIFNPEPGNPNPSPAVLGFGGFVSNKGSWGVGTGLHVHFHEGRYLAIAGISRGRLRYDFYGIGTEDALQDEFIPLEDDGWGCVVELLRRVKPDFYIGPRCKYRDTTTRTQAESASFPDAPPPDAQFDARSAALGLHLMWDARNSIAFPTKGYRLDLVADFFDGAFGSDFVYQVYTVDGSIFLPIRTRGVLALRGYGRFAEGDVPFYDLSMYGKHGNLRGYTTGRWRDAMMVALQAEYRHTFNETWRGVIFAGTGGLAPEMDAWDADLLLPGAGVGVRYVLPRRIHTAIALDLAVGREGPQLYLGLGEFF